MYVQSFFFFSSRRRHTRFSRDWSSDVCSSDLVDRGGVVLAQPAQDLEAAHVRQVDVEQDEIGLQSGHEVERFHSGVRLADDAEAHDTLDVRAVHGRRHVVVVDDERADHRAPASTRERWCGRKAVKTAPPSFSTLIVPSRRRSTCVTGASPRPRRPVRVATFVVKPSWKISSTASGSMPGPESCTRTSTPSFSSCTVTSTHPAPPAVTESSALSTRFPTTVIRSRTSTPSSGNRESMTRSSIPRSEATAAFPSKSATSTGSPTESTIEPTSSWWTSDSWLMNRIASS